MIKTITKCSSLILAALLMAGCRNVICLFPSDLCPTQYSNYSNICGSRSCPHYDPEATKMEAMRKAYERKREKKVVSGLSGSAHKKDAY